MKGFEVEAIEPMTLQCSNRLAHMYVLSPFVWRSGETYNLLVRAVPRRDDEPRLKMAEIWWGRSADGLHFEMDRAPVIFPGPELDDRDGCEDPTVIAARDLLHVWYTGWNHREDTGCLLYAAGPDPTRLVKQSVALESRAPFVNPKEATVAPVDDGWRLLFEYAEDGASKLGIAAANDLKGPWTPERLHLFARPGSWDSWHLSTGPVVGAGEPNPVMFYNGADHDANWRIGWAEFSHDYGKIVARGEEPLLTPGSLAEGWTDIAFAASALAMGERIWIYYSVSDRELFRATVRRV